MKLKLGQPVPDYRWASEGMVEGSMESFLD